MNAIFSSPWFIPLATTVVIIALFPLVAGYIVLAERKLLADFQKSQFRFKELIVSLLLQREFPHREGTLHVASNH